MSVTLQARLKARAAEMLALADAHPCYADPDGFRYIPFPAVCDRHLQVGRHLMVIAPYDPAGWEPDSTRLIFEQANTIDPEGRSMIGCVELEGFAFQPNGMGHPLLEDRLITPSVIARAAGIVRARVRSGQLRGFTLTRLLFGRFLSDFRGDLPALVADIDGFKPGEPPREGDSLPGDILCPTAVLKGGKPRWRGNVYVRSLTPADIEAAARLRIREAGSDWRRPLTGWVPRHPRLPLPFPSE